MGYKCSFAERVVSTAQRLANWSSSSQKSSGCCKRRGRAVCGGGGGRCSEKVQIATASWRKNMYPRAQDTIRERVHFFSVHAMHDARQPL
jgi:hypothetical protein